MSKTKFYATAMVGGKTIKKGEKFEIINFIDKSEENGGMLFVVISKRTDDELICLENSCAHLNGGNWKITERMKIETEHHQLTPWPTNITVFCYHYTDRLNCVTHGISFDAKAYYYSRVGTWNVKYKPVP